MNKLIVNADDFGLSPSVNAAVVDCYRKGNITSATMMVNMPGSENAARLALENPGLSVGLHFCLTEGRPVSKCPSLVDKEGRFLSRGALLLRILRGAVDAADLVGEFSAQLKRMASFGLAASHIDSHQHVHMSPWVFDQLLPSINEAALPLRIVRPLLMPSLLFKRPVKLLKQTLLYFNARRFLKRLRVKSNDCLVMIHDLPSTTGLTPSVYDELIRGVTGCGVVELCVHPYILGEDVLSLYAADMVRMSGFLESCSGEYGLLSRESLFSDRTRFPLAHYGEL